MLQLGAILELMLVILVYRGTIYGIRTIDDTQQQQTISQ
jgi:hypothetical protein